jgi:serine O-acetyltransferase
MEKEYKRIQSKADLKEWLALETARFPNKGKYRIMNWLMLGENAILRKHQIMLRKTEYYINTGKTLRAKIYKLRLLQFQRKYGTHVPPNVFGKGLCIMHAGEIHINDQARAGENCIIHVLTSLAAGGITYKVPHIGDGVVMFMGSMICGDIYVADNVVIGANSVVTKSIDEPNVTVSGVPAQIVSHKGRIDMDARLRKEREEA